MIKPKALKQGDCIGIAAIAGPFVQEDLEQGVQCLEDHGFRVKVPDVLRGERDADVHDFLAASDAVRAQHLLDLFSDPEVDAIFCARGGHGSIRILAHMDEQLIMQHPKLIMGYSDFTHLSMYLWQQCGLVNIHGPLLTYELKQRPWNELMQSWMQHVLMSSEILPPLICDDAEIIQSGKGTGQLIGGNLRILCSSLGTPYEVNSRDRILFIEDINEAPYQVDRMLYQLRLAGKLEGLQGLMFGHFTKCNQGQGDTKAVIYEHFKHSPYPVWMGLPAGHSQPNIPIPIGIQAEIEDGQLNYLEAAVC